MNLLLDLGNVLVGVEPTRTLEALYRLANKRPPDAATAFELVADLNRDFDRGEIDADRFRAAVSSRLGLGSPPAGFDAAWGAMLVELPQTDSLVAELAARHDLYLLSNTDPIHFELVRRRCAGWVARFAGLHLSYEAGQTKPDQAFFATALERFGLDPAGCLFLDDREENVDAAARQGIPARQVTTCGLERGRLVDWGLLPSTSGS